MSVACPCPTWTCEGTLMCLCFYACGFYWIVGPVILWSSRFYEERKKKRVRVNRYLPLAVQERNQVLQYASCFTYQDTTYLKRGGLSYLAESRASSWHSRIFTWEFFRTTTINNKSSKALRITIIARMQMNERENLFH